MDRDGRLCALTMGRFVSYLLGLSALFLAFARQGDLGRSFDAAAFFMVIGSATILSLTFHGPRAILTALCALGQDGHPLRTPTHFHLLQSVRQIFLFAGFIGGLVGFIRFLATVSELEQASVWSPAAATMVMSLVYGLVVAELCLSPLCWKLKTQVSVHLDWNVPRTDHFYVLLSATAFQLWLPCLFYMAVLWLRTLSRG